MLNDSDLQKAAEEMLNDAHDEVRKISAHYFLAGKAYTLNSHVYVDFFLSVYKLPGKTYFYTKLHPCNRIYTKLNISGSIPLSQK